MIGWLKRSSPTSSSFCTSIRRCLDLNLDSSFCLQKVQFQSLAFSSSARQRPLPETMVSCYPSLQLILAKLDQWTFFDSVEGSFTCAHIRHKQVKHEHQAASTVERPLLDSNCQVETKRSFVCTIPTMHFRKSAPWELALQTSHGKKNVARTGLYVTIVVMLT